MRLNFGIAVLFFISIFGELDAQSNSSVVKSANTFIQSLTEEQKVKCLFTFQNDERTNWHFTIKDRIGLAWEDLSTNQRKLGKELISTGLSSSAVQKAEEIMSHEEILRVLENRPEGDRVRHPELYYFSFFGKPNSDKPWGWRFEGHHLSLNFTLIDGKQYVTPAFFGANPAEVKTGPHKGLRILSDEEDYARSLAVSLSKQSLGVVAHLEAPPELLDAAARKVNANQVAEGISASNFKAMDKALFEKLLNTYLSKLNPRDEKLYKEIIQSQGYDKIYFSWRGSLKRGEKHYYRIQGPELWIEYDNTQNDANHIHCVFRGIHNDFGYDILADHYQIHHKK